jgi:hypothetical protein
MTWDPEVESPATIAIIGAGATGIEAALYARFLGYNIMLFDKAKVAQRFVDLDEFVMTEPFSECVSQLGLAALQAQTGKLPSIEPSTRLSYRAFCQEYLLPLARTDLLYDDVHVHSRVVDISRLRCRSLLAENLQERGNDEFRIVIESKSRGPWVARADVVLDCSGLANDNPRLGPGGGIAIGELDLQERLYRSYRSWKLKANEQAKRILLVFGSSKETCDTIQSLIANQTSASAENLLKLIWAIPIDPHSESQPELQELKQQFQNSRRGYFLETLGIESIGRTPEMQLIMRFSQPDETMLDVICDDVLACESTIPGWDFCPSLLVNVPSYSKQESAKLADRPWATYAGWNYATGEPNYYVLGSKRRLVATTGPSESRRSQIRDVFALLGARQDLDLYRSIQFAE